MHQRVKANYDRTMVVGNSFLKAAFRVGVLRNFISLFEMGFCLGIHFSFAGLIYVG
jgi:hypothetical protein